jgi:hypothetical protein
MSIKYTVSQSLAGVEIVTAELENGVVLSIPSDPANSDYQAYLNKDTLASELSNPSNPQAGA